jgi:hypothetical protein
MSSYVDFINSLAELLRRPHAAMGAAFLSRLRRNWTYQPGFSDPQSVEWVRADWLDAKRPCACPEDGGLVRPTEVIAYWAGYRWRVVVGECGRCHRVWHGRLILRADDYAGRDVGRLLRRRFRRQFLKRLGVM